METEEPKPEVMDLQALKDYYMEFTVDYILTSVILPELSLSTLQN